MYGACFERGVIQTADSEGYTVRSLDRDGILTPPIQPLSEQAYTVGTTVFFFLFRDGTGRILCEL